MVIVESLASMDNIYEARLLGWIICKAQSVLKLYQWDLSAINLQFALEVGKLRIPVSYLLPKNDTNYTHVKKAFTLAEKTVQITKEDREYKLNIVAFPTLIKEGGRAYVECYIHQQLWHAMLDFSRGYRIFSFYTYMRLRSKHSIIMFLLVSQQKETIEWPIERLIELNGLNDKTSYARGNHFINRIVAAAKEELDEISPWTFDYKVIKRGKEKRITHVSITPRENENYTCTPDEKKAITAAMMRVRLADNVKQYLATRYGMSPRSMETIEEMLGRVGLPEAQMNFLGEVWTTAKRHKVKNYAGYLTNALKTRLSTV